MSDEIDRLLENGRRFGASNGGRACPPSSFALLMGDFTAHQTRVAAMHYFDLSSASEVARELNTTQRSVERTLAAIRVKAEARGVALPDVTALRFHRRRVSPLSLERLQNV